MKTLKIELPDELANLLESEKETKEALVLDLVRRGKISKGKAAELLGISLWDLPQVLAKYRIPWFDYNPEEIKKDLQTLRKLEKVKETNK